MALQDTASVLAKIGEVIDDAAEETFILFSQELPHNDLGIINNIVGEIDIDINGHEYTILQSSGLLKSNRAEGTTGAVVWKVTPRVAQWLESKSCVLWKVGLLNSSMNAVELGCGVAGLIGMTLSPLIASYVLTDQTYVLKLLRENIARNTKSPVHSKQAGKGKVGSRQTAYENLFIVPFDWEQDSFQNVKLVLSSSSNIDLVFVCDCVYNTYLIEPLTQACVEICRDNVNVLTVVMVAQQLRTDAVFEEWLTSFLKVFHVWRLKDEFLPVDLQSSSGYVVHMCALRSNA